jgi:hypothetical protein
MAESEPNLTIRLKTDPGGRPTFQEGADHRHYAVIFEIENAPPDAYAATFELDPSSYYDPVRTLRPQAEGQFRLETTTYGDYPVVVRLFRAKGEDVVLKDSVARALRRAYRQDTQAPEVDEALTYIAAH